MTPTTTPTQKKSSGIFPLLVAAAVAVACGVGASVTAGAFLKRAKENAIKQSSAKYSTVPVVIARRDLAPGEKIGALDLELAQWPQQTRPATAFADVASVAGRYVDTRIFRGEPIAEGRLITKEGDYPGLYVRIPDGMLAISIKVDAETGISGFIQPANHVDVIATLRSQTARTGQRGSVTRVILQHVLVLAVGKELESKDGKPVESKTVTLALKPEDAEKLALARSEGQLMLALRNFKDDTIYQTPGFSAAELSGIRTVKGSAGASAEGEPDAEQAKKAEPQYVVVQLIEGEKLSESKFQVP